MEESNPAPLALLAGVDQDGVVEGLVELGGEVHNDLLDAQRQRTELLPLAAPVIHIDELFRIAEITDNIKLADRFSFGCRAGGSSCGKTGAFVRVFCPMAVAG
jgi:hypothetical protein